MEVLTKTLKQFEIGSADIILQDYEDGKGKITISDTGWDYNFSYYWGSMGKGAISNFLLSMNESYFVMKLGPTDNGEINMKKTFANIRKAIAEELPWYQHMKFQKDELRPELNRLQKSGAPSDEQLVHELGSLANNLWYHAIADKYDREDVESLIKDNVLSEPWHYFEYHDHRQNVYLAKLFHKLQKKLKELKTQPINV